MDIQPSKLIQTAIAATQKNLLNNLQIGQQVYAKVLEQLPSKQEVILQIGQRVARATTDIPLTPQQTLKLEVLQNRDQITLRILDLAAKAPDTAQLALRRLLPQQQPISELLPRLQTTAEVIKSNPLASNRQLLNQIEQLTQRLIQAVPDKQQLSNANGLKSAFQSSGIFLESAVSQNRLTDTVINFRTSLPNPSSPLAARTDINTNFSATTSINPAQTGRLSPPLNPSTQHTPVSPTPAAESDPVRQTPVSYTQNASPSSSLSPQRAPLEQVDTKANLLRLITLIKNWPGITDSGTTVQRATSSTPTLTTPPTPLPPNSPTLTPARLAPTAASPQAIVLQQLRELLSQSESTLAKISVHQLASAGQGDEIARPQWQTEIPILHGGQTGTLLLRIEEDTESKRSQGEASPWRVTLELNPPHLGTIRCQISLDQQHHLSTDFRAENPSTAQLIRAHLGDFKEQLNRAQFVTQSIQCRQGGDELKQSFAVASVLNETA